MSASAYAAAMSEQLRVWRARLAQGMPRRGFKVGINVPEVQARLGLSHALVGWLDGERVFDDGAQLDAAPGTSFHAEPELCLRLSRAVAADADAERARAAIDAVAPALEIVDYAKPMGSLAEIVAHSMFHHAIVLGAFVALPASGSLAIAQAVTFRAGEQASEPARADLVPASAGELVRSVAARLAECGEALVAGDLIMSGSFCARALPLRPGDEAWAVLGEFGQVRCRLSR